MTDSKAKGNKNSQLENSGQGEFLAIKESEKAFAEKYKIKQTVGGTYESIF